MKFREKLKVLKVAILLIYEVAYGFLLVIKLYFICVDLWCVGD